MAYPKIVATAAASAAYGATQSVGTTSSLSVKVGDSIYVFVGYDAGSTGTNFVQSVTDPRPRRTCIDAPERFKTLDPRVQRIPLLKYGMLTTFPLTPG